MPHGKSWQMKVMNTETKRNFLIAAREHKSQAGELPSETRRIRFHNDELATAERWRGTDQNVCAPRNVAPKPRTSPEFSVFSLNITDEGV